MTGMPYVSDEDVRSHLDPLELIEEMEQALVAFSARRVQQPPRQLIDIDAHRGFFLSMAAAMPEALGVKVVSFYPQNTASGTATHHALILLFRVETGEPLAIVDGTVITELRTAAVSAVATRLLAPPDASVLGVVGSGVQARAHVEMIRMVRPISEVRIWSPTSPNAELLAREVGGTAVADAETAVRGAHVVATCTPAMEPVVAGEWLDSGTHVNAVGWNGPDSRELDDAAMASVVVVDSRAAAAAECGDVRGSGAVIAAELGEALEGGDVDTLRAKTTVFESVGLAVEDVAAAQLVWKTRDGT